MDLSIMAEGFALTLMTAALLALLFKRAVPALPSCQWRMKFLSLAGLASAVMIHFGEAVWWRIPWEWKLHQPLYDAGVWVIAGLALAKFVASSQGCTRSKLHKRNDIAAVSWGPLAILPEARVATNLAHHHTS